MNSYKKGKRGMNEVAKMINEIFGCNYRVTAQTEKGHFKADLQRVPGSKKTVVDEVHIEVKRLSNFAGYKFLEQAEDDNILGKMPVVCLRANGKEWIAILDAKSFFKILNAVGKIEEEIDVQVQIKD